MLIRFCFVASCFKSSLCLLAGCLRFFKPPQNGSLLLCTTFHYCNSFWRNTAILGKCPIHCDGSLSTQTFELSFGFCCFCFTSTTTFWTKLNFVELFLSLTQWINGATFSLTFSTPLPWCACSNLSANYSRYGNWLSPVLFIFIFHCCANVFSL